MAWLDSGLPHRFAPRNDDSDLLHDGLNKNSSLSQLVAPCKTARLGVGRGGPGRGLMLTHALSLGEGRVFLIERNRGFAGMTIYIGRA